MTNSNKLECKAALTRSLAYSALALSILCRSLVFVFAKYAALGTSNTGVIQILLNHWYWAELTALGMQAVFWIYALKHLSLNVAYPTMAFVYGVNLGWAWYLFDETVTPAHVIGCGIIIIGVIITISSKPSITTCPTS